MKIGPRFLRILQILFAAFVFSLTPATAQLPAIPPDAKASDLYEAGIEAYKVGNYEAAVHVLRRAVELQPSYKSAWNDLGRAYHQMGREKDAIASFNKAIELDPFSEFAYNNLGLSLKALGQMKEAETAFRKQIEVNPLDRYAHKNLGSLLLEARRPKEAIAPLEIANRIDPKDLSVRMMLGIAYQNTGDQKKSQELIQSAMQEVTPEMRMQPADPLVKAVDSGKAPELALQDARRGVVNASKLLQEMNEPPGRRDIENSNALVAMWAVMGDAYLRKGDLEQAEKYLQPVWQWSQSGIIADRLGQIYEKQGKKEKAQQFYRFALQTVPAYSSSRSRLASLVGGEAKTSEQLRKTANELSMSRTVQLGKGTGKRGSGEYMVLFGNGGKVDSAKFSQGEDVIKGLEEAIMASKIGLQFPEEIPVRLARVGLIYCTDKSCSLVFMASMMNMTRALTMQETVDMK